MRHEDYITIYPPPNEPTVEHDDWNFSDLIRAFSWQRFYLRKLVPSHFSLVHQTTSELINVG